MHQQTSYGAEMKNRGKKLWIAWEDDGSIRSRVLSKEMNAIFRTFTTFEGDHPLSFLRYPTAIWQTFFALMRERPRTLVVQNPSIVLSFFAALVKPVFRYQLIIDLHTLYISPKGIKKFVMDFLNGFSLKRGDIVIVTNESYREKLQKKIRTKIAILPDRIPDFEYAFTPMTLRGKNNVLFICTFSEDEPWEEVIQAGKLLDQDTFVYISGKNQLSQDGIPPNVVLTGFIPDEDYQNLIRSADIIMVLTEEDDCMVCGAYEAVSAEKPLILSDKKVLREYFSNGTVFTRNNREDISKAITLAIKNRPALKANIQNLKKIRSTEWKETWDALLESEIEG